MSLIVFLARSTAVTINLAIGIMSKRVARRTHLTRLRYPQVLGVIAAQSLLNLAPYSGAIDLGLDRRWLYGSLVSYEVSTPWTLCGPIPA
jgi:hypothetical protein